MSLQTRLQDLATRLATECKAQRTLINGNSATLASLTTTAKTNLVLAINELDAEIATLAAAAGAQINDAGSSGSVTWSASKIAAEVQAAKTALSGGSAAALDTLAELAAAIAGDASFATTMTTALGNRVRFDAVQSLTAPQKTQACTNLGIGEPETDLVTVFNTGLV